MMKLATVPRRRTNGANCSNPATIAPQVARALIAGEIATQCDDRELDPCKVTGRVCSIVKDVSYSTCTVHLQYTVKDAMNAWQQNMMTMCSMGTPASINIMLKQLRLKR